MEKITVLVHLNLEFEAEDDEDAENLARAYLAVHRIPPEDIADVEAV